MSDGSNMPSDVLIGLVGLALEDLPENDDSSLVRALRRRLTDEDGDDVIAEWNQCP